MDGKHARLTGQTSPLGALLDHGIDAFVAFTTGVAICATVDPQLSSVSIMTGFCCFHSAWFVAQWEMREVGSLDARGITEGELTAILIQILPGLAGLGVFRQPVPIPSFEAAVPLGKIVEFVVAAGCGLKALYHIAKTLSTQRRISSFMPIVHWALHVVAGILFATTAFYKHFPLPSFLIVGMDGCLLMTKAAFAATTHTPWPRILLLDGLPFLTVAVAAIAGFGVNTLTILAVFVWQSVVFVLMWADTISRLCHALSIPFLAEIPAKRQ